MQHDVLALSETHMVDNTGLGTDLRTAGFSLVEHNPAVETGRKGTSAGVAIAAKQVVQVVPFRIPEEIVPLGLEGRFAASLVRLQKFTVVLLALYLREGEGLSETNIAGLQMIEILQDMIEHPILVMGDSTLLL